MFVTVPPQTLSGGWEGLQSNFFDTLATHPVPPASGEVKMCNSCYTCESKDLLLRVVTRVFSFGHRAFCVTNEM